MDEARKTVGIIGLGLMGSVLAGRLIDAGHAVLGFDLDPEKGRQLESRGGRAASVAAIVAECPTILLALFNTQQVEAVVEREISPAVPDGESRIVVSTSTCDPDAIAALAARVEGLGIRFLEVPVSGTSAQVRDGDGVALVGGDAGLADEIDDLLGALFKTRFLVGSVGNGNRAKLAVNLILGLNRLALAEGLVFAERLGLKRDAFLDVARGSAAYSQVMDTKGPKMVAEDFSPEGKAAQSLKDFRLMLDQAWKRGQKLPAAELYAEIMAYCVKLGEGELDNSVLIRELRRRRTDANC